MDRNKLDQLSGERLAKLLDLPGDSLKIEDVAFLWARQDYLTDRELKGLEGAFKRYKAFIAEKDTKEQGGDVKVEEVDHSDDPYFGKTRKELNAIATEAGIKEPEKLKTNQEVIDAITATKK